MKINPAWARCGEHYVRKCHGQQGTEEKSERFFGITRHTAPMISGWLR